MTYKDFKKKLLDLDITIKEFSEIFGLNRTTVHKSKDNVSNQVKNYIILLEHFGVRSIKEVLNG